MQIMKMLMTVTFFTKRYWCWCVSSEGTCFEVDVVGRDDDSLSASTHSAAKKRCVDGLARILLVIYNRMPQIKIIIMIFDST